jgi:hypothetical protein
MRGGSVGRAVEAAQQRSGDGGQFCGGVGSARAAEAAQRRRWMRRRQLGGGGRQGGVSGGGRAVAAAAARRWRWHGGRGGGGGSPITPATALPILLWLGDVAVSLCGMRGCGGLRGGSVTPVCRIPVNRVDEVVRFVGTLTKKN